MGFPCEKYRFDWDKIIPELSELVTVMGVLVTPASLADSPIPSGDIFKILSISISPDGFTN